MMHRDLYWGNQGFEWGGGGGLVAMPGINVPRKQNSQGKRKIKLLKNFVDSAFLDHL